MAAFDIQQEIKDALLDPDFLLEFVKRIKTILYQLELARTQAAAQQEQIELYFSVSPSDQKAFMIDAKGLYSDNPRITVFDHDGLKTQPPTPYKITERIRQVIIEGLRKDNRDDNSTCFAGLRVVNNVPEEATTDNDSSDDSQTQAAEVSDGETTRE
jgi:hypothetical protein